MVAYCEALEIKGNSLHRSEYLTDYYHHGRKYPPAQNLKRIEVNEKDYLTALLVDGLLFAFTYGQPMYRFSKPPDPAKGSNTILTDRNIRAILLLGGSL